MGVLEREVAGSTTIFTQTGRFVLRSAWTAPGGCLFLADRMESYADSRLLMDVFLQGVSFAFYIFSVFLCILNAAMPIVIPKSLHVILIQVLQVESENKRKRSRHTSKGNMRSRHAPKGQRAHSPGHRPGYDEVMKCALKGQKH